MLQKLYNSRDPNRLFFASFGDSFMILRFNDLIISRKLQLSRNEMQLRRRL